MIIYKYKEVRTIMIKPPDVSIIPLMESIKNQELSYNNFCKALNIPKKSTDSIPSQVKSLEVYCKIEINKERYPKTYKIIEIYNNTNNLFNKTISRDKYQKTFEILLLKALMKNNFNTLRLSGIELLNLFGIGGDNFKIACNSNMMRYIPKYKYCHEIALIALRVIKGWIITKVDKMNEEGIIKKGIGYRGYKAGADGTYNKIDIKEESEEKKICERIYNETFEKMEETNKGNQWRNRWFPIQKGEEFERTLKEKVRKELEGYDTIKKVTTIKIGNNIDIIKLMEEIKKENNNLGEKKKEIDEEVKRKIMERGEFKGVSEREKKEFIEIVIEGKRVNLKEEYNKIINYIDKKKKEFIFQVSVETGLMMKDIEEMYKKDIEKISRNYLRNEGKKYERKD